MKYPLTHKAYNKLLFLYHQLGPELRNRKRMRYLKTILIIEKMDDIMIARGSWERKERHR